MLRMAGNVFPVAVPTCLLPKRNRVPEFREGRSWPVKVKDIMTKRVVVVSPETAITEVAKLLLEKHINGVPVVDRDGRVVGIICQSDLIAQQKKLPLPSVFNLLDSFIPLRSTAKFEQEVLKISATTASRAMTANPVTVGPETSLEDAATLMVNRNFHTLPVVDNGILVGIVGKEDILRTIMPEGRTAAEADAGRE